MQVVHDWTAEYERFWGKRLDSASAGAGRAMNLDVALEEFFPHPVDAVWQALTESESISDWLMRRPTSGLWSGARFG